MNAVPRSCPTCKSIGKPQRVPGTGLPGEWCNDVWHKPSHVAVSSPTVRSADPLVRELSDGLNRITVNYSVEGSGPGSRFEGKLLEDVQAEWVMRELLARELSPHGMPLPLMPPMMTIKVRGGENLISLICQDHGQVLELFGQMSLRTLSFEARRHWREHHG